MFPSLEEFSTVCCDSHKGFGIVNKTDIDVFLELSCFSHDPADVGNLISGSAAFLKPASTSGSSLAEVWLGEFWTLLY